MADDPEELDDYYAHPEMDPLFADMFQAEGIPFPDPDPAMPVVDPDLYEQPFAFATPSPQMDLSDPVSPQLDSIAPIAEITPGEYPVHTVSRDSIPRVAPEPQLFLDDLPSSFREVHLFQEPPPPVDEGSSSSRPAGLSRSYCFEPERVKSVGKCDLKYMAVSDMPFITDPYILHPELLVISHDSNPLVPAPPVPHYNEEDIEPLQYATLRYSVPSIDWDEEIDRYFDQIEAASQEGAGTSGAGAGIIGDRRDDPGPSGSGS